MFGQVVVGPPGSGKSTYCHGMHQFLSAIGRKCSIVNLDPANDMLSYPCDLDIRDFITLEEIMNEQNLGPNGGLMYALESLESSVNLLVDKITKLGSHNYMLFDCPGQVELITHHSSLMKIFKTLEKEKDFRLVVVSLIDSFYITSASQYVSILLLALRSMLQLDLPHINVFSKIDLLANYGKLPFRLDYYTEVQDLSYLEPYIEKESSSVLGQRYAKLTSAIAELVEDFGLVSFEVIAIEDKQSMINLLSVIDKANGYSFGSSEISGDTIWAEATRQGGYLENAVDLQERWITNKVEYEEAERKKREEQIKQNESLNKPVDLEDEWEEALKKWEDSHANIHR